MTDPVVTDQVVTVVQANRSHDALMIIVAVVVAMALPSVLLVPRVAAWATTAVTVPNVAAVVGVAVWALTVCVYLAMAICWLGDPADPPPSVAVKIRRRLVSASVPFVVVGEAWIADKWGFSNPERTAVLHLTPLGVDLTWVGVAALIAAPWLFSATRMAASLALAEHTKPRL